MTPGSDAANVKTFEVNGPVGRLRGWTAGSSDLSHVPILWIHGLNLQGACWREVHALLAPPARFGVMPDLRGHGGSDPTGPFGIADWVEDALAVLDHFSIERAHVVGGSLGGAVGVALADAAPSRVASLVTLCSPFHLEGSLPDANIVNKLRASGLGELFREFMPGVALGPHAPRAVVDRCVELANPHSAEVALELWSTSFDIRDRAARVRCPVTVVVGEFDNAVTAAQAQGLATSLGVDPTVMTGVGHLPMLEAPRALARLLDAHLDRAP